MPTGQTDPPIGPDADPTPASDGDSNGNGDGHTATQRAEQIVDDVAERVGRWTSVAGRALLRWGARAREEAEDIWAEAQHIRRGGGGSGGSP